MAKVKVTIMDNQRQVAVTKETRSLIRRVCSAAVKEQSFPYDAEVNVSLVDDEQIHSINLTHRGIDSATDVLSFPLGEGGEYDLNPETNLMQLGDIVISLEHAVAQAKEYGHSVEREVGYLTAHSMMHLFGFDHVNSDAEAAVMRSHEEAVMSALGLER